MRKLESACYGMVQETAGKSFCGYSACTCVTNSSSPMSGKSPSNTLPLSYSSSSSSSTSEPNSNVTHWQNLSNSIRQSLKLAAFTPVPASPARMSRSHSDEFWSSKQLQLIEFSAIIARPASPTFSKPLRT
ncbi:hypothetical protein I7I53_06280 [Histoplasma capsulatum var. duboisii H88]|uniref:Uncharacterized protein n=1 Tax=Ajellomyces capsulatus (strain H88) TaxID=544711 RepID=A0A8A1LAR8_AJEC8|nr:hypothetical protein I7I53_06280 [Histoplasma capsulatum var. duboisii H88]